MRLNMLFYKCFVCFVELSGLVRMVPIDVLAYLPVSCIVL
jgi:hypothetical protein